MSETTIAGFLAAVRRELRGVPAEERDEAVAALESLLRDDALRRGERDAVAALGDPAVYARQVRQALGHEQDTAVDPSEPQGRLLGMPYDFRGATADRIAARIWNPADPRIFTPRMFGVGWAVNLGALAVKLRLMRPDDLGDELFDRIPERAVTGALAVPALLATANAVLMAISWRALPAEVPVHWNALGQPDNWAPKALALGGLFVLSVLPVAITAVRLVLRRSGKRERVLAAAALGLIALLGLGLMAFTVNDADGGATGGYIWMVIIAGIALSFLLLYVPSRLGLRAEWREAASRNEGA